MSIEGAQLQEPGPSASGRKGPVRLLSAGVFIVLVAATIALTVSSRRVVDDQEQRLLEQRAAEVSALFNLSGTRLQEALRTEATVIELMPADGDAFSTTAKAALASRTFGAIAVVEADGDGYRIVRAEGASLSGGRTLGEPAVGMLHRAQRGGAFVSTPVFQIDGQRRIGYAVLVPNLSPRTLIYAESVIQSASLSANRSSSLFSDLDGAVYAGARAEPAQLVLATAGFRLGSGQVRRTINIGADAWLVELSPRQALVGSLASRQPWLYFFGGIILALLLASLVELLLRRRRFALGLVDERTAQLRQSLVDLDSAQHRLIQSERLAAIGQLASAVGHELRNPLGVLSNVFYLLGQRLGREDPWVARQLTTGEREVAAATLIVSDLLEYSKPRQPVFETVEIDHLVDEVLSVAPPPTGVEVGRRLPPGLPPVRADRQQLRQVLLNLVCNAYDAMSEGGLLVLEGDADDDAVRFTVSDTGDGIADDALPRLFEPFFTTKAKGIGLGLSVAHRIVEAHGGSLDARTNAGTGASFSMTLPVSAVPATTVR